MYVPCPKCGPNRQKSVSRSLSVKEKNGEYWVKCFHADQCEWNTPHKLTEEEIGLIISDNDFRVVEHEPLIPIPDDVPIPDFGGTASYLYRTREGKNSFVVVRYDTIEDGKPSKTYRPICYTVEGQWVRTLPKGKHLYNADKVIERPTARVLVVEGEKAADKAQDAFDSIGSDTVVVTWPGGCSNFIKGDWELLKGRDVVIWPDNDPCGKEAGLKILSILTDQEKYSGT